MRSTGIVTTLTLWSITATAGNSGFARTWRDQLPQGKENIPVLQRTYDSSVKANKKTPTPLGSVWCGDFEMRIREISPEKVQIKGCGAGNYIGFTRGENGTYTGAKWAGYVQTQPRGWQRILGGEKWAFDHSGRLKMYRGNDGVEHTYLYNGKDQLVSIRDSLGHIFSVYQVGPLVRAIRGPGGTLIRYNYDNMYLASVMATGQDVQQYSYKDQKLVAINDSGTETRISYRKNGVVKTIKTESCQRDNERKPAKRRIAEGCRRLKSRDVGEIIEERSLDAQKRLSKISLFLKTTDDGREKRLPLARYTYHYGDDGAILEILSGNGDRYQPPPQREPASSDEEDQTLRAHQLEWWQSLTNLAQNSN